MKVTICDVCKQQPAEPIQVPVGRTFNGVQRGTDYKYMDLCLKHAIRLARCTLMAFVPEDKRAEAMDNPREAWQG